ncbi:alpha/beta hydrolase family protein [Massilia sp. DWR3-1-1]|uniref:S9 family peptidase n=1 Tax=Massilia sp. DWR3-1-1 TaxID=2804559 RepID=UPI003CF992F7
MFLQRLFVLALFPFVLTVAGAAPAAPSPLPPVEGFFDNPGFSGAVLSPDATFLAVRTSKPGGRDMLAVVDLSSMAIKVVANFGDTDIGQFAWVNNERLLFTSADKQLGDGDIDFAPGLYAVNRDGSYFRQLAERRDHFVRERSMRELLPWHTFMLSQPGAQNSEWVYVASPNYASRELRDVDLLRLNTLTGRTAGIERPPGTREFLLDQKGEPRIASAVDGGDSVIWYRDPQTDKWRKLAQFSLFSGRGGFTPVAFGPDGTLFVEARMNADKSALYRYDFAANAVEKTPVLRVADFDFDGAVLATANRLLGVRLKTDADTTEWFDPAMKALQARVDARLPATVNLISVAPRAQTPWVLVQSHSDQQPRVTTLFNTETGVFNKVGEAHAQIDPARMGRQDLVRFKARDGRSIPAWLTLPHDGGGKNLPMVVLVHGGPYVRGSVWGWHADAQFLASRGYAVLEPEFRGSTGYGFDHFKAGWKQWGLAMQDDVADATRWAIAGGVADPKRICIAGASYGGYATLMGLVNDPDLYRCGVDWVGVTDIELLFNGHWSASSDVSEIWKRYGMPVLVGDPATDHAKFQATSPLAQASRITQPLLLAYGGADRRVPIYHGKKFYAAVKVNNPNVEYVEYGEEGHGWALPKNRFDFWRRVERFLDKQIGAGRPQ